MFLVWLSGQIDQMSKWLVFGLIFQSNKPWFVVKPIMAEFFILSLSSYWRTSFPPEFN
jgi:hypothetical protein